ncbi:ABC transporter-like protein, partial [Dinothrombium tinctorium]
DSNRIWNTTNPFFTSCFEDTVIKWIPCLFLWLFTPFEIYRIRHSDGKCIPWTIANIFKIMLLFLLVINSLLEMSFALIRYSHEQIVYPVEYYSPFIMLITFILVLVLVLYQRKKGIHSSGVLFIFWLLMSFAMIIKYRTIIMTGPDSDSMIWSNKFLFVIKTIYIPLVIAELVMCCFADTKSEYLTSGVNFKKICPADSASFLSFVTFWWVNELVILGVKRPLKQFDIWHLSLKYKTVEVLKRFSKMWNRSKAKQSKEKEPNATWILVKTFWPQLLLAAVFHFVQSVLIFVNPIILDNLITFVSSSQPTWRGYFFVLLLLVTDLTNTLFTAQYQFQIYTTGLRIRSCLISSIYRKVSLASFATYVLISSSNILDPNKAFVSLTLFNIMRLPLARFPLTISQATMGEFAEILAQFLYENLEEEMSEEEAAALEAMRSSVEPILDRRWSSKSDSISSSVSLRQRKSSLVRSRSIEQSRKSISKGKLIEAEAQEAGSIKLSVYKQYIVAIGVCTFIISLFSFVGTSGFNIASSLWLSEWSNDATDPKKATDTRSRDIRLGVYGLLGLETPLFLIAVVPLGILYYIIQKFYVTTSRQLNRIEATTRSPVYSHFSETVTGTTSIRAYGAVKPFIEECHSRIDTNHSAYFAFISANRWLETRLEFLGLIIAFLAAIFAVIFRDTISPGLAGVSISYALTITDNLNLLVRSTSDVETNMVSVERCFEYSKTPLE